MASTRGRNCLRGILDHGTWEIVPVISRCAGARGIMHVENTFALGVTKRMRPVPRTLCREPSSQQPAFFVTAQGQGSLDTFSPSFFVPVRVFPSPPFARPVIQRPTRLGGCRLCLSSCQLVCPALEAPPRQRIPGTCGTLFSSQRPGLASLFLISSVCHPNSPGMHFPSSLDSLQKTLATSPPLHRRYIPSPTDFVGKVCLPRITIPVFEIEPGSAHSHTTQLGTRQRPDLHSLLHKTTLGTVLRPSSKPELDSFVFRKIESSIASRDCTS